MNETSQPPQKWAGPFFTIWTAQAVSLLGSQLVQFALIWWLTQKTESATVLATASLVGLLPQVVLGPFVGALVDRWNRRLTMIVADSIIALATVGIAALFWLDQIAIWHVYVLMFVRSLAGGFHWPAMTATTSLMVPKENLTRIQGFNQMLNGGMNIASAPLGALLLEILPIQGVLAIDVITAIIAITPLFLFTIPQPKSTSRTAGGKPSFWQDFMAGLRYAFGWPGLLMILGMALLINLLLTPAFELMPILVVKHFEGGVFELAWMNSAWGIGVIAGGLILGAWGGFKRQSHTSMVGLLALGAGSLVLGLLPPSGFVAGVVAMLWLGIANPITNGPLLGMVQAAVDPEMQGRIFTLIMSAASAMAPLGLLIAGPIADHFGVQAWLIAGGIVSAIMGIAGFNLKPVVTFEEGHPNAKIAEPASELEANPVSSD